MKPVSIVIPVRAAGNPSTTLETLARQTFQDFDVIVSWDRARNANTARNAGFRLVRTPYVLFSDDDIRWEPHGIESLHRALTGHPEASYSYGAYAIGEWVQCNRAWSAARLRERNFISTMSLIRSADFPGFDEAIARLQDWDLWLSMLAAGKTGAYCGELVFRTEKGDGITYGEGTVPYQQALYAVRQKHGLHA